MRTRFVPWAALLGLALLPGPARPDEAKPDRTLPPAVVVRVGSIDSLMADLRYLTEVAGKEEAAKELHGLVKNITGPKGLEGVDTKKPLGVYASIGPLGVDSTVVVLVPVADEKAFLALIENVGGGKPEKGDDGLYTLNVERIPVPIYLRFANGYAYASQNKDSLDKDELRAPAAVLPAGQVGTASATVNINRIPEKIKQLVLGQIDLNLAKAKDKARPDETEAQAKFRAAVVDDVSRRIKSLLRDGGPLDVRLDLDRAANDLVLSVSLAGKPQSDLAATIHGLGQVKSLAASLVGRNSAMSVLLDVALPPKVREALGPVIDEGAQKALERQKDKSRREILAVLLDAIKPTVKSAEVDAGLDIRGPADNNQYTVVAGIKVKDGEAIDKALRKAVADLPAEQRDQVQLDAEKVGSVSIHRLKADKIDPKTREMLGDNPIFVAVRDDAVLAGAGDKGLSALKEALGATPRPGRVAQFEIAVKRVAPLMERENKGATEAAKKAFTEEGSDRVRITLEGGPALKLRLAMKAQLLKFVSLLDESRDAADK
jgi:hypothetical protein